MSALFLLIDLQGAIGGAQKRYVSIANQILSSGKDIKVVINNTLYDVFFEAGLIAPHENLVVLNLGRKKAVSKKNNSERTNSTAPNAPRKRNQLLHSLGRLKYFLKNISIWIRFSFYFLQLFRKNKFRVIYSVWHGSMFVWPWRLLLPFRLIITYNDSTVSYLRKGIESWFTSEYKALKIADQIDFLSANIRLNLEKEIGQINNSRVLVSPCSFVDTERFQKSSETIYDTIFLSRLNHWKSPLLYLEIISILNKTYDTSKLLKHVLIGTGELSQTCHEFAMRHDLTNVSIVGEEKQPEKYLSKNRLFFSLQKIENYPSQSLLEAMASENAIIATDVGETRKIIDETVGVLVKPNAMQIADVTFKLIQDCELVIEMGKRGRKRVLEEHSSELFMAYFYSLLN